MQKNILSLEFNFDKFPELNPEIRKWIARMIGSVVVADHRISPQEKVYVSTILKAFEDDPEMQQTLHEILDLKQTASVTPLEVSTDFAEAIFRYILKVCLCDRNLAPQEIQYLHEVGSVLGIDTDKKRQIFKQNIFQAKQGFFEHLIDRLRENERYWLAVMILKIIYADHRLHQKELPYLNHIAELVDNSSEQIKAVKEDAANLSFDQIEKVVLDQQLSGHILEYLLRIVMIDQEFTIDELHTIKTIAKLLGYDEKRLKKLINLVKADYQFLFT